MGDKFPRQAVDAGEPPVGLARECRQLPVIAPGQVQQNLSGVALDDVFIVEEPLGGRRHALFQAIRYGEIQACFVDPPAAPFDPFE